MIEQSGASIDPLTLIIPLRLSAMHHLQKMSFNSFHVSPKDPSIESLLFWSAPNNYWLHYKCPPSSLHNRCSSTAQVNTNTTILALQSMQSTLTYSDDPTPHESPSISYSAVLPIGRAFRVLRLAASSSSDYISPCIGICKKEVHVSSTKVVEQRHNHEPAQHK